MKKNSTNRNHWNSKEDEVLLKEIKKGPTNSAAFVRVAKILHRSAAACSTHFYHVVGTGNQHKIIPKEEKINLTNSQHSVPMIITKGNTVVKITDDIWYCHHNVSDCYYHIQLTIKYRRNRTRNACCHVRIQREILC